MLAAPYTWAKSLMLECSAGRLHLTSAVYPGCCSMGGCALLVGTGVWKPSHRHRALKSSRHMSGLELGVWLLAVSTKPQLNILRGARDGFGHGSRLWPLRQPCSGSGIDTRGCSSVSCRLSGACLALILTRCGPGCCPTSWPSRRRCSSSMGTCRAICTRPAEPCTLPY